MSNDKKPDLNLIMKINTKEYLDRVSKFESKERYEERKKHVPSIDRINHLLINKTK
jgi:thymidylate kinase